MLIEFKQRECRGMRGSVPTASVPELKLGRPEGCFRRAQCVS